MKVTAVYTTLLFYLLSISNAILRYLIHSCICVCNLKPLYFPVKHVIFLLKGDMKSLNPFWSILGQQQDMLNPFSFHHILCFTSTKSEQMLFNLSQLPALSFPLKHYIMTSRSTRKFWYTLYPLHWDAEYRVTGTVHVCLDSLVIPKLAQAH